MLQINYHSLFEKYNLNFLKIISLTNYTVVSFVATLATFLTVFVHPQTF